ncbi:hypothetical protein B9Z55_013024 [Caenorhabditis nigoni]|uniref:Uncharacterized protein n=1 Tax=Caenorhabditis nigoni TaxID=1611254 RepID=A0A2G5U0E6_9PELO|nr:hypothetical protein B9Z55_013024 [Caenorhabditis nigoni]
MDSNTNNPNPNRNETSHPAIITWITYLYTSFVYYFWLIYARLPQRITDDKSDEMLIRRDADIETIRRVCTFRETQTARQDPAPKDSSLLSLSRATAPSADSFDCNNCLAPHKKTKTTTCSPTYVSNLSLRRSKKTSVSSSSNTFSSSLPSPNSTSSESTISPSDNKKLIAVVPSGSHVLVAVPKLDWKTESIRIKRTRMSDWLDAEQRDVMRQFDEVIRIEEEAEEDQKNQEKKKKTSGILMMKKQPSYGSTRSIESGFSSSKVSIFWVVIRTNDVLQ